MDRKTCMIKYVNYKETGGSMRVAIFDFDGTLYKQETFQLLMNHLKKHPKHHTYYGRFFRAILPRFIAYKLKLYPEARMKEQSMQLYINALQDLSQVEVNDFFKEIADKMQDDFNESVVAALNRHRENNVYTMLVSGAFIPLLESIANQFPFDQVIGTNIPFKNDKLDRETPIYHVQGERKTKKIHEILQDKQVDWENSYAYGDSYSDLPVLELVGNPVAVQPDERLRALAVENKWTIL